jgi:hypothetical protein
MDREQYMKRGAFEEPTPEAKENFEPVIAIIDESQRQFRELLLEIHRNEGFLIEYYIRYLTMQYHLTKGVQRFFMRAASHHSLLGRTKLRDFLYEFALEEEPHYQLAERDSQALGYEVLQCPLDVKMWWAYFLSIIDDRPMVRLGAACVLENLGPGSKDVAREMLAKATYITPKCMTFLEIHFHEALPHGDQIINALCSVRLKEEELRDLQEGAAIGSVLYMRMANWVFKRDRHLCPMEEILAQSQNTSTTSH